MTDFWFAGWNHTLEGSAASRTSAERKKPKEKLRPCPNIAFSRPLCTCPWRSPLWGNPWLSSSQAYFHDCISIRTRPETAAIWLKFIFGFGEEEEEKKKGRTIKSCAFPRDLCSLAHFLADKTYLNTVQAKSVTHNYHLLILSIVNASSVIHYGSSSLRSGASWSFKSVRC